MIEELKTPDEWSEKHGVRILDPDGWRMLPQDYDTPISEDEYLTRLSVSTIQILGPSNFKPPGPGVIW